MPKTFKIEVNAISGEYQANTAQEAILAYLKDAGYNSIVCAIKALDQTEEEILKEIIVTEIK